MGGSYRVVVRDGPFAIAAAGLLALVAIIMVGILARNLEVQVGGIQTVAQLIGVWLAFVVAGGLAYQRRHIEIDYFTDKLAPSTGRVLSVAVSVLSLLLSLVLFIGGIIAAIRFWDSTATNAPIPIPVYYAAITLGGLMLAVVYWNQLAAALGIGSIADLPSRSGDQE